MTPNYTTQIKQFKTVVKYNSNFYKVKDNNSCKN